MKLNRILDTRYVKEEVLENTLLLYLGDDGLYHNRAICTLSTSKEDFQLNTKRPDYRELKLKDVDATLCGCATYRTEENKRYVSLFDYLDSLSILQQFEDDQFLLSAPLDSEPIVSKFLNAHAELRGCTYEPPSSNVFKPAFYADMEKLLALLEERIRRGDADDYMRTVGGVTPNALVKIFVDCASHSNLRTLFEIRYATKREDIYYAPYDLALNLYHRGGAAAYSGEIYPDDAQRALKEATRVDDPKVAEAALVFYSEDPADEFYSLREAIRAASLV